MTSRRVTLLAALAAVLGRWPGLLWPPYPDEAGFLTVAATWEPSADSMYGHYFVDRSPILIGVFRVADLVGGPDGGIGFLRVIAALGVGVLVLAAAALARQVTGSERHAAWTAIVIAAITSSRLIDPIAAQGEVLALPLIVGSLWLSLRALERRSLVLAAGAGLAGMLALGLKQSLATALLFGAAVLLSALARREITGRECGRLALGASLGAAIPVVGVVVWALSAGVGLDEVWYDVYGFRSDALAVITGGRETAALGRAAKTAATVFVTGLAPIAILFALRARQAWRVSPTVTAGAVTLLVVDGASLALGGSFWPPYVFALVPGTVLFVALLLATGATRPMRWLTGLAIASTLVGMLSWIVTDHTHWSEGYDTGAAIAAVAEPGDTIQVYGGRADVRFASGLRQDYPYLWGLPMRTLDPDLVELKALLAGEDAPTWFVAEVTMKAWGLGERTGLQAVIDAHYDLHATGCGGEPVYLLRGETRQALTC